MNESITRISLSRRIVRWLLRLAVRLLAVFGLLTAVYLACFRYSRITSPSMSPTLQGGTWEDGDRVVTEKVSFWFRQPRRWEVITVRCRDGMVVMKRVVGLPGEEVQMLRHGEILINGTEVTQPASLEGVRYLPYGNLMPGKPPVECGEGFFVLGDDSDDSLDSRYEGIVMPDQVIGRAWLIVGPAGRRGFVNP